MTKVGINAFLFIGAIVLVTGLGTLFAAAQSNAQSAHIAIDDPASLSKDEAQRIYNDLMDRMDKGYASSGLEIISGYQDWPKFNDAPYVSTTHGQRFVNNYANTLALGYGTMKEGEKLPVGSVLAKDSMTVTQEDHIFPGALFVMEKLPAGQSPATADWRYVMILPDGSIFGDTIGDRRKSVAYCHGCHQAVADRDYTFYVPEKYRVAD
jgi:hypothetical protein